MEDQKQSRSNLLGYFATEGTRRVTEVAKEHSSNATVTPPDPEVPAKPERRQFSKNYKLRILQQWDRCAQPGEKAALLRREGLYSQTVANWLKQRQKGNLKATSKPVNTSGFTPAEKQKLMRLELENEKLKSKLVHAERIIDLQKKIAELMNLPPISEDEKI